MHIESRNPQLPNRNRGSKHAPSWLDSLPHPTLEFLNPVFELYSPGYEPTAALLVNRSPPYLPWSISFSRANQNRLRSQARRHHCPGEPFIRPLFWFLGRCERLFRYHPDSPP